MLIRRTGHILPKPRSESSWPPPTMMWSCNVSPRYLQPFWISFVMVISASEGVGSPEGWLWTFCAPFSYVSYRQDRLVFQWLVDRSRTHNGACLLALGVSGFWAKGDCRDTGRSNMSPSVISLQGCKPRQHGSVISPRGLACASGCDRFKQVQGIGLHAYGYLGVAIGGLKINMPQPAPNDVNLHACLEEMDRCSMPEHVRREVGGVDWG